MKKLGNKDFILTAFGVVVVAALMIGAAVYLNSQAPADDGSYVPGETAITPDIELLRDYVRIDTTAGKEIDGARFLFEYLERQSIPAEMIESAPGRANVYARIEGREPGGALMLLSHIDVVRADPEKWSYPPFEAEVALDRVWGRGTLDMKGTAITQLLAFVDVAESGQQPAHDLIFLATADEESGSALGVPWLIANRPDIFEGTRFVITEGGLTETVREKLVYFAVETGSKNIVRLRVNSPRREDLERFRAQMLEWDIEPKIERLLPGVDEYFRAIAPRRTKGGEILADVRKAESEGRLDQLGENYLELMQNHAIVRDEVEPVDGGYTLRIYLSLLPDEDPAEPLARIRELLPRDAEMLVEFMTFPQPSRLSPTDTPLFRELEEEVKETWGEQTRVGPHVMLAQTTDCRFLRSEEIDCYGLWPFQVTFFESQGIHGVDERLKLSWFVEGVEFMKDLVRRYLEIEAPK